MNNCAEILNKICSENGFDITAGQLESFARYRDLLIEWSEKMNLTAIKDDEGIALKHFYDSILLTTLADIKAGGAVADVGAGAGFPSLPCKIVRPDITLTMIDSLNKRVTFLNEVVSALGLADARAVHARAEEAGRTKQFRESFDVATARAVAHLRELSEYCLPLVKVGGVFAAMKSGEIDAELDEAKNAIKLLGGRVKEVKKYNLPDGSGRSVVIIKKISQTSTIYPRPSAKMAKKPL